MCILTDDSGLQVHKDGSGDVFAGSSLAEEGVEGVVSSSDGLVTRHLTVRLDAVLQAVELPAGIAHLDSGLADMHRDTLTLWRRQTVILLKSRLHF